MPVGALAKAKHPRLTVFELKSLRYLTAASVRSENGEALPTSRANLAEFLHSIVQVARAIFGAGASSIFLLDEATGELTFEAVAGAGEGALVGQRIPGDRGIAGWVVNSGQAVVVDNLLANPTFARDLAEDTGTCRDR